MEMHMHVAFTSGFSAAGRRMDPCLPELAAPGHDSAAWRLLSHWCVPTAVHPSHPNDEQAPVFWPKYDGRRGPRKVEDSVHD